MERDVEGERRGDLGDEKGEKDTGKKEQKERINVQTFRQPDRFM